MESTETRSQCEHSKAINILLVEDNPGDIRLTQEVLNEGKICNNLFITTDGQAAMDFLNKTGDHKDAVTPDVVLLDLNLPKKDGKQVLSEIKVDPNLKSIPVVVLTTSAAEQDILNTYSNHANAYITKPIDLTQFIEVMRSLENF